MTSFVQLLPGSPIRTQPLARGQASIRSRRADAPEEAAGPSATQ